MVPNYNCSVVVILVSAFCAQGHRLSVEEESGRLAPEDVTGNYPQLKPVPFPSSFAEVNESFDFYDRNANGRIDIPTDLLQVMVEAVMSSSQGEGLGEPPLSLDALLGQMEQEDTSQDGAVSLAEHSATFVATSRAQASLNLARASQLRAMRRGITGASKVVVSSSDASAVASAQAGFVRSLWTFGAPGTSVAGFRDKKTASGCFPGVRSFTSSLEVGWLGMSESLVRDPVTWISHHASINYLHARMEAMELRNKQGHVHHTCTDDVINLPRYNESSSRISLHMTSKYMELIDLETHDAYPNLDEYARFVKLVYDTPTVAAASAKEVGWSLVGVADLAGDACHLYQDPATFDCALSFRGTDSAEDWLNNIDVFATTYCQHPKVHHGFQDELNSVIQNPQFQENVRALFPKCRNLDVIGHSMGGACAELFSYCSNAAPQGDTDYGRISWEQGSPALLPEWTR